MGASKQTRNVAPTTRHARKLRKVRAQTGGLSEFPEIRKFHARCTLCKLAANEGPLLREIHYRLRSGVPSRKVAALFAEELEDRGLPTLDFRAIARHYKDHVENALIVNPAQDLAFQAPILPAPRRKPAAASAAPISAVEGPPLLEPDADLEGPAAESYATKRDPKTDDEADYFELRKLYDRLLPMLDLANKDLKRKASSSHGLTHQDYKIIVTMYSECRQQLEALNKMRNSNRLTRAVIEAHTSQVLTMLSEPLGQKLRDIRRQLEHGEAQSAVLLLSALIESDLPPMLVSTGKEAIRRSVDEYKLH